MMLLCFQDASWCLRSTVKTAVSAQSEAVTRRLVACSNVLQHETHRSWCVLVSYIGCDERREGGRWRSGKQGRKQPVLALWPARNRCFDCESQTRTDAFWKHNINHVLTCWPPRTCLNGIYNVFLVLDYLALDGQQQRETDGGENSTRDRLRKMQAPSPPQSNWFFMTIIVHRLLINEFSSLKTHHRILMRAAKVSWIEKKWIGHGCCNSLRSFPFFIEFLFSPPLLFASSL